MRGATALDPFLFEPEPPRDTTPTHLLNLLAHDVHMLRISPCEEGWEKYAMKVAELLNVHGKYQK